MATAPEPIAEGPHAWVASAGGAVFATRPDGVGRAWDLRADPVPGPPVEGVPPDPEGWAFGALPAPDGGLRPLLAWRDSRRILAADPFEPSSRRLEIDAGGDMLGLAVVGGRPAIVGVEHHGAVTAWHARTGRPLLNRPNPLRTRDVHTPRVLSAPPDTGPLVGLPCEALALDGDDAFYTYSFGVLDLDRDAGPALCEAPGYAGLAMGPGPVTLAPGPAGLLARDPFTGKVLAAFAADGGALGEAAAVTADARGGVLAAAEVGEEIHLWRSCDREPFRKVEVPGVLASLGLTANGVLLAAADTGLYAYGPFTSARSGP